MSARIKGFALGSERVLIELPMYGINISVPEGVYAPAEDSFLLLECALKHCSGAKGKVLEIGTGSGLVACALARKGLAVEAVDIDAKAAGAARKNAKLNKLKVKVRKAGLFGGAGKYGCVVFNPPYVECEGTVRQAAVDGGRKGREVIDRFLTQLPKHLEKGGFALLVQSLLNGTGRTMKIAKEAGLKAEIVARERLFFEELLVFRLKRAQRNINQRSMGSLPAGGHGSVIFDSVAREGYD